MASRKQLWVLSPAQAQIRIGFLTVVLGALTTSIAAEAHAQIPGMPGGLASSAKKKASKGAGDTRKETVAPASGPIKVQSTVSDDALRETLDELLHDYPGVRHIRPKVKDGGVVRLTGQVDDDSTRDELTAFTKQVEGVRLVINDLNTDAEVLTAPQLVMAKVVTIWDVVSRRWLLALLALGIVLAFAGLARLFNAQSEMLLAPFVKNPMLRSVFGSAISSVMILGGLAFGLSVLNLTHAVLSVLGLAGVVGLAVGFAFKDIAENFIASVLLGVRRPFLVGDFVTVAGQTGVVKSLNTRATVLVTLEGNHVRIPNNVVYKEILVNATASVSYRVSFDVVIPYDAATSTAVEAMTNALRQVDGILSDPPARALVEALEPGGVRLKAYYWIPVKGVDLFQINSDAKLRAKVALQQAGILGTPPAIPAPTAPAPAPTPALANGMASAPNGAPSEPATNLEPEPVFAPASASALAAAQAAANLHKDALAAEDARGISNENQPSPMEHALNVSGERVSSEGANLLAGSRA